MGTDQGSQGARRAGRHWRRGHDGQHPRHGEPDGGRQPERPGHGRDDVPEHAEPNPPAASKDIADKGRPHVLIVDDDPRMLRALSLALAQRGFTTSSAADAGAAFSRIAEQPPDVIVLDVVMPVIDGRQLSRLIRDRYEVPILMLTGLDGVEDRVAGLEAGADDYVAKPFAIEEVVARLHALLRRPRSGQSGRILTYGDLVLDTYRWEVRRGDRPLVLTSKEFRILEVLMRAPGRVFTREEILEAVWTDDDLIESNVVDVHIGLLRRKMEAAGGRRLIQTIRGVGYSVRE